MPSLCCCCRFAFSVLLVLSSFKAYGQDVMERIPGSITVDGNLEDWKGMRFEALGCASPFERSFSGLFYSGWDEEGLYFAAQVFDDELSVSEGRQDLRSDDCLELFLDTRGIENNIRNPYSTGDALLIFNRLVVESDEGEMIDIDDRDPSIIYSKGNWSRGGTDETKTWINNSQGDAWIEAKFHGSRVQLIGAKSRQGGAFSIYIDNEHVGVIDTYFPSDKWRVNQTLFDSGPLEQGEHAIRVEGFEFEKENVLHGQIQPDLEGGCRWLISRANVPVAMELPIASTRAEDGWSVEGMIPWSLMGGFSPRSGSSIRFAYKLYDSDSSRPDRRTTLGLRRHGSRTTADWIAKNPIRFPKVKLIKYGGPHLIDAYAKEVWFQGQSWIDVDVVVPAGMETIDDKVVVQGANGKPFHLQLLSSPSGRFKYAKELISVSALGDQEKVDFELSTGASSVAQRRFSFPLLIQREMERIEAIIPEARISSAPECQIPYVRFYKACAEELAEFLEARKNREIMHYNMLPLFEDQKLTRAHIDSYLEHARMWLESDVSVETVSEYPHQIWQSESDGSWQSFNLQFPKDYDPEAAYDVAIIFHYVNKKRFSRIGMTIGDIHNKNTLAKRSTHIRDGVTIQLTGRGNSFAELGEEEFEHALEWVSDRFGNRTKALNLFGFSVGGEFAALFASRYTDKPQLLSTGAGTFSRVRLALGSDAYDDLDTYVTYYDHYADKIRNLENFPVHLTVGGKDYRVISRNAALIRALRNSRFENELKIIPGRGHDVPILAINPLSIEPKSKETPKEFKLKQHKLRYGSAYWLAATEKLKAWRPYSFEVAEDEEGNVRIETDNLRGLSIDNDKLRLETSNLQLIIDGQAFKLIPDGKSFDFEYDIISKAWKKRETEMLALRKAPKLEGPIGDIEKEGFIIVYGTKDPGMTPILFNRARRVLEDRVGSDEGQWSGGNFIVKADSEVSDDEFNRKNLWLIGNVSENRITEKVAPYMPIRLTPHSILLGNEEFATDDIFLECVFLNPISRETYVYIESALSPKGYYTEILKNRDFDFSVSEIDGVSNRRLACGVFDPDWGLREDASIIWRN